MIFYQKKHSFLLENYVFHFFLLIFNLPYLAQSQHKSRIDSLSKAYKHSFSTERQIDLLNQIAFEYHRSNPDTCLQIAKKALLLSEKLNYTSGKAWAYNRIGIAYIMKGELNNANTNLLSSNKLFEQKNDKYGIATNFHFLGNIYLFQEDYQQALS